MIERLLEMVHGMPPDLAEAHLVLNGVDAAARARVQQVLALAGELDGASGVRAPAAPSPFDQLEPGDGRYQRVRLLSDEGATAEVWLARDQLLAREVALKHFREGGRELGRVIAEARAAAKVRSDHVVAVHDVVRLDGRLAIVMERVGSGDGAAPTLAERGPMPVGEAVRALIEIARGVAAAHEKQVFHLDLKPGNVLVAARDGRARMQVGDFGLARVASQRAGGDETFVGVRGAGAGRRVVAGTIPWMAPEQAAGLPWPLDPVRHAERLARIDVHGLGVLAYALFTGRAPRVFEAGLGRLERLARVARGEGGLDVAVAARAAGRRLPRALAAIVRRAMAVDASERPRSARDVAAALEAWLARAGLRRRALVAVGAASALALGVLALGPRGDRAPTDVAMAVPTTKHGTLDVSGSPPRRQGGGGAGERLRSEQGVPPDAPAASATSGREAEVALAAAEAPAAAPGTTPRAETAREARGALVVTPPPPAREPGRERPSEAWQAPPVLAQRPLRGARLVTDPEDGSPERVVLDALAAALEPDAEAGWAALRALLHSGYAASPDDLEQVRFRAFRRRARLMSPDSQRVSYWLDHVDGDPQRALRLFVVTAEPGGTELGLPRPFRVERDAEAGDAWRLMAF